MVTAEEVAQHAMLSKFLKSQNLTTTSNQCHSACAWIAIQLRKADIIPYNVYWASGTYNYKDHSWLVVEEYVDEETFDSKFTIVDLTLDQFEDLPVPYVGPELPGYQMEDSCNLIDTENLKPFIESLGM